MLFTPEAHGPLAGESWSAERARTAIAEIVDEAENAFDDGWPTHPQDVEDDDDASTRFRTVYLGGAGVVDALRRLALRGLVELRQDYVPYLEQSLDARPDFPDADSERSLWAGETGIRLVLQRLAPSQANLERLTELIAANEQDERCELMWGSPGTILAGRELGLDVTASVEWLRGQRDSEGLWTQLLYGRSSRMTGPAHGFAGCVLALGDVSGVSETLQPLAVEEDGLVNWLPYAEMRRLDEHRDGQIRTQWCHGAPGIVATLAPLLDEERRGCGRRADVACRPAAQGCESLPRHGGERVRISRAARAHGRRALARHERARSRCTPLCRWSRAGWSSDAGATRSGRATSAPRSTSRTASTAAERFRSRRTAGGNEAAQGGDASDPERRSGGSSQRTTNRAAQASMSAPAKSSFTASCSGPGSTRELAADRARSLEERTVATDVREVQVGKTRLARAEERAAAAQVEVDLRELEAVGRRDERLEPLLRGLRQLFLRARDEQAVRLLRAAPDAAAQLVQLREAEAVGLLHDHHRRVRNVDTDLDHRRRDEHVEVAGLEARHQLAPLGRLDAAVQAADAELAQLGALQARRLLLGRARERRLRRLDQRADDVRLAALGQAVASGACTPPMPCPR